MESRQLSVHALAQVRVCAKFPGKREAIMGLSDRLGVVLVFICLFALTAAARTPVSPKTPFALKVIGPGV
jgi:hypothetical protein